MTHMCPVCGYPGLSEPSHDEDGDGSYEICTSCGCEFGVDDDEVSHAELRARWVASGARWWSQRATPPEGWDGLAQLKAAGLS